MRTPERLTRMFILTAVMAAFVLTGCGNDGGSLPATTDNTTQGPSSGSTPSDPAVPSGQNTPPDPGSPSNPNTPPPPPAAPPSETPPPAGEEVPPPDSGACNVMRDSYDGTDNWGYLTIGRHYNDAARITVTGNYTVCKLRLKMYQYNDDPGENAQQIFDVSIFTHDPVLNAPGKRIGNPSAPMNASSIIKGETNNMQQAQGNYTAIQDVYFDLDVPVTPGTYWIVFKNHNYNDINWQDRLRNNIVADSSNAYMLRGRALSYSADPSGVGQNGWSEFYTCQVRYALYSN